MRADGRVNFLRLHFTCTCPNSFVSGTEFIHTAARLYARHTTAYHVARSKSRECIFSRTRILCLFALILPSETGRLRGLRARDAYRAFPRFCEGSFAPLRMVARLSQFDCSCEKKPPGFLPPGFLPPGGKRRKTHGNYL